MPEVTPLALEGALVGGHEPRCELRDLFVEGGLSGLKTFDWVRLLH
jgi:hypothetical protein